MKKSECDISRTSYYVGNRLKENGKLKQENEESPQMKAVKRN
jgi:hypothetical protein